MTAASRSGISNSPVQASIASSAFLVAAGIFFSRISGLIRDRVFSHFFGLSFAADAFRVALRIPNFLQNLFGEGVLSASFIPVYAKLLAEQKKEEAGQVAGVVLSLLALITSILVLTGVLATPYLIDGIAPGFSGKSRMLAIQLVRIFFPGVGLLVLSAWCLGILNSHSKFFLSYVSPVAWNLVIIVVLIWFRRSDLTRLAVDAAWASVLGSVVQFLLQLPVVLHLASTIRLGFALANQNLRVVIRNFFPVFVGRGVTQLSAYIYNLLASFLPTGAVAGLFNAQTLYMLPISLFGMSVSAAELPAMSSTLGDEEHVATLLRARISSSTRRIAFLVVPSAIAFLTLGDVVAAAIYQTGKFTRADTTFVWMILAGSAIGLVATTVGRLYSSAYYALRDTRTPLRYAIIRVMLTSALGYLCALQLPKLLGIDPRWGVAGLTASAGFSGWLEMLLLRRGMNRRIGYIDFQPAYFSKLWVSAVIAAAVGWSLRLGLHPHQPLIAAAVILIPYGLVYLGMTATLGIDQTGALMKRFMARGNSTAARPKTDTRSR